MYEKTGERPSDGELCPRDSLWDYLWDNALLVTHIVTATRAAFVVTNFHFATARSVAEGRLRSDPTIAPPRFPTRLRVGYPKTASASALWLGHSY